MEVMLTQLMELAPELASTLRDDVRQGRLPAERKKGVAGRPYVVKTEDLVGLNRSEYRELASLAENLPAPTRVRRHRSSLSAPLALTPRPEMMEWASMLESQHLMLKDLVSVLTQEMRGRYDRIERQELKMQELSYKLGQAHQEIARLERMIAERNLRSRIEEA